MMLDRASIIDDQFIQRVKNRDLPEAKSTSTFADTGLAKKDAIDIFDSQIKSRQLDLIARQLKEKGLSYYTIGSSGHEGNAVFGQVFRYNDMAFLHYRSGAFYVQRCKQTPKCDPVHDVLLSLVASAAEPIAGGRHKVFGSVPLYVPPQTSTIASHLPKALGTAMSITRTKELNLDSVLPKDAVIICSFGDASVNHATAQTTFNACSWITRQGYPLPMLFICEDNGLGISVPTPQDWIEKTLKIRPHLHYIACDGLNIADCYAKAQEALYLTRVKKKPVFLHMRCVRLLGHAGSDIESQYRNLFEIEQTEGDDPLLHTARMMIEAQWMTPDAIIELYQNNHALVQAKAVRVANSPSLNDAASIMASIVPQKRKCLQYPKPTEVQRQQIFSNTYPQLKMKKNLCQLINFALTDAMLHYPNMMIFGEDVGKKGGVYRVTADLQKRFGQRRVFDTLLDETTILGTAIGMAHNGLLPVPEIQFLAYLHNAEDQLRGEASTLSFFSNGQYQNPMVIRVASLAYQKGFGGHFHNDNSIAVLRDLPGVIVACPSNGADAVKLLRTCLRLAQEEGRIVVFLEPIALYMTKDLHEAGDGQWLYQYPPEQEQIALGEISTNGSGKTVIITYANGYYLSRQAQKILDKKHGISVRVVDLHWLSPLPEAAILQVVSNADKVLIVDEGRRSASLSEGILSLLVEHASPKLKIKRLTGEDCFIPLGQSWQHLLPSCEKIIAAVRSFDQKTAPENCKYGHAHNHITNND